MPANAIHCKTRPFVFWIREPQATISSKPVTTLQARPDSPSRQLRRQAHMKPSSQHPQDGRMASTQLPRDLPGTALGLQDAANFSLRDTALRNCLTWEKASTMSRRLAVVKSPPVTTAITFQPPPFCTVGAKTGT